MSEEDKAAVADLCRQLTSDYGLTYQQIGALGALLVHHSIEYSY